MVVLHVVEGAGLGEGLDDPLVADQQRHLLHEVVEVLEAALAASGLDDLLHDVGPDVAYGGQAEADVVADGGEVEQTSLTSGEAPGSSSGGTR